MELKLRLQRVLQIVEETERVGAMSDLERDIILTELREAYSEVKFGAECVEQKAEHEVVAPVVPQPEPEPQPEVEDGEEDEPEVEFEIIYNEEDDEEESDEVENETPIVEPAPVAVPEPIAEPAPVVAPEPVVAQKPIVEPAPVVEERPQAAVVEERVVEAKNIEQKNLASELSAFSSTPRRSAILSLYEESVPVVGEQFHETPSVADAISCPKAVAESAPLKSLRDAIGVADKFMLIRELFGGDNDAYEATIETLDKQPSFDDCVIYIAENCSWRAQSEGTKFMMELLQRKYNA